jgi:hypothetical protein
MAAPIDGDGAAAYGTAPREFVHGDGGHRRSPTPAPRGAFAGSRVLAPVCAQVHTVLESVAGAGRWTITGFSKMGDRIGS